MGTGFTFLSFVQNFLTVSYTMMMKWSPGREPAGDRRSTSKSTCVVPAWPERMWHVARCPWHGVRQRHLRWQSIENRPFGTQAIFGRVGWDHQIHTSRLPRMIRNHMYTRLHQAPCQLCLTTSLQQQMAFHMRDHASSLLYSHEEPLFLSVLPPKTSS